MAHTGTVPHMGFPIVIFRATVGAWGFEVQRGRTGNTSVEVAKISPNSPAECAGLVVGDQILSIDNIPVIQLFGRVTAVLKGNTTTQTRLQVLPHPKLQALSATFGVGPQLTLQASRKNGKQKWGLRFQWNDMLKIVLVVSSQKGCAALKAGVMPGDKLISINGQIIAGSTPIAMAEQALGSVTQATIVVERRVSWATVAGKGSGGPPPPNVSGTMGAPPPAYPNAQTTKGPVTGNPPQQHYPIQQQQSNFAPYPAYIPPSTIPPTTTPVNNTYQTPQQQQQQQQQQPGETNRAMENPQYATASDSQNNIYEDIMK